MGTWCQSSHKYTANRPLLFAAYGLNSWLWSNMKELVGGGGWSSSFCDDSCLVQSVLGTPLTLAVQKDTDGPASHIINKHARVCEYHGVIHTHGNTDHHPTSTQCESHVRLVACMAAQATN